MDCPVAYSIVVPVYNSAESLCELFERLAAVFADRDTDGFELLLVDDASSNPDTWTTMEALQKQDSRVVAMQLMQNTGQQNAILCGLHAARGDRVLIMDDDLQHPPEEIPKLIAALDNAPRLDVIIGVPEEEQHAIYRNISRYLFGKLMNVLVQKPRGLRFASFILMRSSVRDAMARYRGHRVTINSLICQNTSHVENATVNYAQRKYGQSGYTLGRLIRLALNHVFNFSSVPLKAMIYMGATVSVLTVLYALLILYQRLTGRIETAGFATIIILMSLYSGVLLTSLGIVGQYLLRLLRATTYGQQYSLRQVADSRSDGGTKS
jgi:glycosyltransferase involved in cell wall biosynthesis